MGRQAFLAFKALTTAIIESNIAITNIIIFPKTSSLKKIIIPNQATHDIL